MKATLSILVLALAILPAFAAEQYSFINYGSGDNLYSEISFSQDTALSMKVLGVVDSIYGKSNPTYTDNGNHKNKGKGNSGGVPNNPNKDSVPGSESGSSASTGSAAEAFSTFGYYVNDAYVDLSEQLAAAIETLSTIDLGIFSEGDTIRFVKGANGLAYGLEDKTAASSDFKASYNVSEYTQIDLSGMNYDGSVDVLFSTASVGAPSGQPLPGVLATLLIGGGLFGAGKLRRRAVR